MTSAPEIAGGEIITTSQASPAARCIQLRLLGYTFQPIYTHQLFDDEIIRGYVPPGDVDGTNEGEIPRKELTIQVDLAPSCDRCQVSIHTKIPKRRLRSDDTQKSAKRVHADSTIDNNNENNQEFHTNSNEESDKTKSETSAIDSSDSSSYVDDDVEESGAAERDEEGNTRQRRMPQSEIKERLSKALPKIVSASAVEEEYLAIAPGTQLEEYERKGTQFCLTLANGPDMVEYHNEVQKMARFFIETADDVDVANQSDGGHWKVLYLFQMHNTGKYSLAGYLTLFHFNSPFRKPVSGIVVRICQALVLPPYQRSGHGYKMMSAVYKWAFGKYNTQFQGEDATIFKSIVEINVEDPAPSFVALRNRVDYHRFLEATGDDERWFGSSVDYCKDADVSESHFFDPLHQSIVNEASVKAKITPKQVQVVYELLRLRQLQVYQNAANTSEHEALEKRYRLMVKKRLQREFKEDLGACNNKEEKKSFLTKLYNEVRQQYETITRSQCLS